MKVRLKFVSFFVALLASTSVAAADCSQRSNSPESATCAHMHGFELFEHGDWEAAAAEFQHAASVWMQLGDHFQPALARSLDMLGESHAAQERWPEAERAYRGAVAAAGSFTVNGAAALSRLAYVLARQGRAEEARREGHKALSLLPSRSLERPMVMHVLASVEPAAARRWLSAAVSEIIAYGKPHAALARILEDYAAVLIEDRNAGRALPLLRRAEAMYGPGDVRGMRVRRLLAELEAPDRRRHEVSLTALSK